MLREVTKSMLGFSWAVSLFTLDQLTRLITSSSAPEETAASEFDALSRAVQSHLSAPVAERFRQADEWQRRVVDAMFDAASLGTERMAASMDPKTIVDAIEPRRIVEAGVAFVQRSVGAIRQGTAPAPAVEPPPVH